MVYFTYFYLTKGFWIFLFSAGTWFFLSAIWNTMRKVLIRKNSAKYSGLRRFFIRVTDFSVFWLIPLANLIWFQMKWNNLVVVLLIGILWFAGLFIYRTGQKLTNENIDIYRLEGRFRGLRKTIYKIVAAVPLIGKKKRPFKALSCVSLEIGNGMFGLLGPNGAGKTTLMRVICGILEQSYGKV
jgi:ABC-type uncharacterized transport system fused permease/ATPase subunit